MKKVIIVIAVLAVIVVVWYVHSHNSLVALQENVNSKWSQVENVYQRRLDLIPNLVATVKGYASHESDVLEKVTELRSRVGSLQVSKEILDDPDAFRKFQTAQGELGGALSRLLAVSENYPDLKASENFLALQSQLEGTENRIAVERKRFTEAVQEYNATIRRIPTSIVASIGGFRAKAYFEAATGAEQAPQVKF